MNDSPLRLIHLRCASIDQEYLAWSISHALATSDQTFGLSRKAGDKVKYESRNWAHLVTI